MNIIDNNKSLIYKKGKNKHKDNNLLYINVKDTQYAVISEITKHLGWYCTTDMKHSWHVYWTDSGLNIDKYIKQAKIYQRINHFNGMVNIYRKNYLSRSMIRMQRISKLDYDFYPDTWILPYHYKEIVNYLSYNNTNSNKRIVIIKPSGGAQGKGIYLATNPNLILPDQDAIVQSYIANPLLIDGYKFDLRIYCLITCCNPLRLLIYRDGLVRLCTNKYNQPNEENIDDIYMHLTNYAVNKHNSEYIENNEASDNEEGCSKRSLNWLWKYLQSKKYNCKNIWDDICHVINKTMISIQAHLSHCYRNCKSADNPSPLTCFEVLGFDIMLTDTLNPILLEVNHTPSFRTDSLLDNRIKSNLIKDTMLLLNLKINDKTNYYKNCSTISQIRLYGSTFHGDDDNDESRYKCNLQSYDDIWNSYISDEKLYINGYDLVYPTNVYINQPNLSKQSLYDELLQKSYYFYQIHGMNVPTDSMIQSASFTTSLPLHKVNRYPSPPKTINRSSKQITSRRKLIKYEPPKLLSNESNDLVDVKLENQFNKELDIQLDNNKIVVSNEYYDQLETLYYISSLPDDSLSDCTSTNILNALFDSNEDDRIDSDGDLDISYSFLYDYINNDMKSNEINELKLLYKQYKHHHRSKIN